MSKLGPTQLAIIAGLLSGETLNQDAIRARLRRARSNIMPALNRLVLRGYLYQLHRTTSTNITGSSEPVWTITRAGREAYADATRARGCSTCLIAPLPALRSASATIA